MQYHKFIVELTSSHALCACNEVLFFFFGLVYVRLGIKETRNSKKKIEKLNKRNWQVLIKFFFKKKKKKKHKVGMWS